MRRIFPLTAGLALVLSACATADNNRYYTLVPPAAPVTQTAQAATTWVRFTAVRVPDVLDRSNMVVRSGQQQVVPLSHSFWRSPLQQELQDAFSTALQSDGRIALSPNLGFARTAPEYAVQLGLERLDIALGQFVRMDVSWTVQKLPAHGDQKTVVCRASWSQNLSEASVDAAVAAQQTMVQQWAQQVQGQLLAGAGC